MLLGIVCIGLAQAHIPHENTLALAPAMGLDAATPWLLVYKESSVQMIARSTDAGRTWSFIGGAPLADELLGGGQMDDGTVVLLGEAHYWTTRDFGETWTASDLPGEVDQILTGDRLWLAGPGGVWSGTPGSPLQAESVPGTVAQLGPGVAAITTTGRVVHRGDDGTWVDDGAPALRLSAVAAEDGVVVVGTADGTVHQKAGADWTLCGAFPAVAGLDPDHPAVGRVALADGVVYAAAANHGPYRAEPGCAAWSDRATPEDPYYTGPGNATQAYVVWAALAVVGETVVTAGYNGVSLSSDGGRSWFDAQLVPADTTTAIAFAPGWPENPRIWFTRYDHTVMYTDDFGLSLDAPSHGLSRLNNLRVVASPDPAAPEIVYAVSDFSVYRSEDGGAAWAPFGSRTGVASIRVWDGPDAVWLLGGPTLAEPVATTDGGTTWTTLDALSSAIGASTADVAGWYTDAAGVDQLCVLGDLPSGAWCSSDGGARWETVYTGESDDADALVGWPEGGRGRLLIGDDAGLWVSDDGGAQWTDRSPWGADHLTHLTRAPGGLLFAVAESGRVARSADGGDTWEELGVVLGAHVYALEPRPDFRVDDDLLVAAHDGAWVIRDAASAAPRLSRWMDVQRVDDESAYLLCPLCLPSVEDPSGAMDSLLPFPEGAVASVTLRGSTIRVFGTSDGASRVGVFVDGVQVGEVGTVAAVTPTLLGSFGGLGEGLHAIELRATEGAGFSLDTIELETPSEPLGRSADPGDSGGADTAPGDTATADSAAPLWDSGGGTGARRCACAAGPGPGLGAVLLAFVALLRRGPTRR